MTPLHLQQREISISAVAPFSMTSCLISLAIVITLYRNIFKLFARWWCDLIYISLPVLTMKWLLQNTAFMILICYTSCWLIPLLLMHALMTGMTTIWNRPADAIVNIFIIYDMLKLAARVSCIWDDAINYDGHLFDNTAALKLLVRHKPGETTLYQAALFQKLVRASPLISSTFHA